MTHAFGHRLHRHTHTLAFYRPTPTVWMDWNKTLTLNENRMNGSKIIHVNKWMNWNIDIERFTCLRAIEITENRLYFRVFFPSFRVRVWLLGRGSNFCFPVSTLFIPEKKLEKTKRSRRRKKKYCEPIQIGLSEKKLDFLIISWRIIIVTFTKKKICIDFVEKRTTKAIKWSVKTTGWNKKENFIFNQ